MFSGCICVSGKIANFKDAFGNNATASLLLGFAQKHMPEELASLLTYQHAYNAASRYINVVNQMLEHLLERLG